MKKLLLIGLFSLTTSGIATAQLGLDDLKNVKNKVEGNKEEGERQMHSDFKQDIRPHMDALNMLDELNKGNGIFFKEKEQKQVAEIESLAELCRTKYKDYKNDDAPEYFENPKVSCTLALKKDELIGGRGKKALANHEKKLHSFIEEQIEHITEGKIQEFAVVMAMDFKKWKEEEIADAVKNYGSTPEEAKTTYATLDKHEKPLAEALKKSTSINRYSNMKSNKIDNVNQIKKEVQKIVNYRNDMKLVDFVAVVANPTIEKALTGIPVRKQRNITIVVQKKGENFCRMYTRMFTADTPDAGRTYQDYSGGDYGLQSDSADYFILTKC